MHPRYRNKVTVRNPGAPTTSAATGNQVPGEPVEYLTVARLSQRPVENLSSAIEMLGEQATSISMWSILVPPPTPLLSSSQIVDEAGRVFEVEGQPATRYTPFGQRRPIYTAAALRLVSDLQGV